VLICNSVKEAEKEIRSMLGGKFGQASERVVIEEFLQGIEFSVFVLTDGRSYKILPIAKDYKRIGEGDTGLNTGGMGSISPVPFVDENIRQRVVAKIIEPTIKGIQSRGLHYYGFIFFGLILVNGEPYVIEYNCRMGDPETQSVLVRLENDLLELVSSVFNGDLENQKIKIDPRFASAVIAVSGGYPEAYEKGKKVTMGDAFCFHAGTRKTAEGFLTSGGRVVAMMGLGQTMEEALKASYDGLRELTFEGMHFRSDIGFDLKSYVQ